MVAKDKRLTSLQKVKEEDEALIGHMMLTVSKLAKERMKEGFRVVTENGKDCNQQQPHLCMHVLGGQQLKWPPTDPIVKDPDNVEMATNEESKEELKDVNQDQAKNELYEYEMGFSLVIKAMIDAKKPFIGHNCMYDLLYVYN